MVNLQCKSIYLINMELHDSYITKCYRHTAIHSKRRSDFMEQSIYKMKNYSKEFLQKHKFKYSSHLSEYVDEIFTYKFPLIYSIKIPVIECEISVSTVTGIANLNIYKAGTKELYPPYYNKEYGNYKIIMRLIDTKINRKLKELGIEKG